MSENPTVTFDLSEFRRDLQTTRLGHPIEYLARVTSTSDNVLDMARRGAPEGTLVVAEEQTAGRGRQGAVWYSPPGCGIWASVLLRPRDVPLTQMPPLSMCAAYAVSTAIEQVAGVSPKIKWPNDVLLVVPVFYLIFDDATDAAKRGLRRLARLSAEPTTTSS